MIYISILWRWRLCEFGRQSERVRTYLSSVAENHFFLSSATAWEHTRGSRQVCLTDRRISAFSPKWRTLYCLSSHTYFLFKADYRNLYISGFFPVICWSYLQTEISVILSTRNKFFSFLWNHFVDVILRPQWIC